jgi:acetoin utilization deacetylase AcuC-like enzyme
MDAVASRWRAHGGEVVAPREATREHLTRVHDPHYVQRISEIRDRAVSLDPDTYTSPESYEVALLAAGAAIDAVERTMSGSHAYALAMVRPPGHHAEEAHAMGFCLFNNVAVAAAHARHALGARRVAIVDYDVHHGNGTQHIFDRDPSVLYVSTHQYPYYPGTGAASEIGSGAGEGFTVNLPLESGGVDADFHHVFERVALPVLRQFAPDLILVSAGFDAHERDPLATMRATEAGFAAMTISLRHVADETCRGRLGLVTEGGYDLKALDASLEAVVHALSGPADAPAWPAATVASTRGRASADAAVRALKGHWQLQ